GKTTELDARAFHDPEVSGRPQGSGDTSIILQPLKIRRSDYINRQSFENYKFDVETSTVLLDLDGSQVQCNTLTCRLGSRHATISVHPEYSFLPVASERGDGLSVWRSKLIELKKLTD